MLKRDKDMKNLKEEVTTQRKFKVFNIFTEDGVNKLNVEAPYRMTLDDALSYFKALSIAGVE